MIFKVKPAFRECLFETCSDLLSCPCPVAPFVLFYWEGVAFKIKRGAGDACCYAVLSLLVLGETHFS